VDGINNSINRKTSIILSRNNSVALVVGAAGFLGSHLVDKLLDKGIQIVGVDDFSSGKKENLDYAIKNRNFHLIETPAQDLDLDLERLDYLLIVSSGDWNISSVLKLFKEGKCKCIFVSSINLYDQQNLEPKLKWFKEAESNIAKFAQDNKLNARILRLGPIYGPRMSFETEDPIIRLIQQALNGDLQKDISLEFSSRALYIDDVVELIIKSTLAGATALKIFDAVSVNPIKVEEIKQVLLDPVWYDSREFVPSQLPPWLTPNLEKTINFLNWHPKVKLVNSLKQTLSYFKDNEISVPIYEKQEPKIDADETENSWKEDKKQELEGLKKEVEIPKIKHKKGIVIPKISIPFPKIFIMGVLILISYAIIWPIVLISWGVLTFRSQISEAAKNLEKGEFEKSLENVRSANFAISETKSIFESFEPIRKMGFLKSQFQIGDNLENLAQFSASSAQSTVKGVAALYQGLKAVTGELNLSPGDYFITAQIQLANADGDLAKSFAMLNSDDFKSNLPIFLKEKVSDLAIKLSSYSTLIKKARALSALLPEVVAQNGTKNYLVLLQNNNELRPAGGFIGSVAIISFEGGKLKKLDVKDVYTIDGQLNLHVEPPKEIAQDLNQKDYYLRDSNWEPDFPTSARQAEWFYTKETGERVEGVLALDLSAIEDLLFSVGPLDLTDYSQKITSENLFEQAQAHSEIGFFPGSQAKKSFLTSLTTQLFNKIFFLPGQSWPAIVSSLGRSLEQKHMSIYLENVGLFSYLVSQNWTAAMPRASAANTASLQDFLAPVEANLGANKANYYLDRSYNLETTVGKEGEIYQRLRVSYVNRSTTEVFPGGKYKNRMRIYLPFGTKLTRVLWGEVDITKSVSNFVDYGRTGYSFLLELAPKEAKVLVLDYQILDKLQFKNGLASYRLDIVKQAGVKKDPFVWKISYPLSYQVVSNQTKAISPQEQIISTDLSVDRSFAIQFKK